MNFDRYKALVHHVYGHQVPPEFDQMPDTEETYLFVASLHEPTVHGFEQCADLFSVCHMTGTQLRNIKITGKTQWKGDRK